MRRALLLQRPGGHGLCSGKIRWLHRLLHRRLHVLTCNRPLPLHLHLSRLRLISLRTRLWVRVWELSSAGRRLRALGLDKLRLLRGSSESSQQLVGLDLLSHWNLALALLLLQLRRLLLLRLRLLGNLLRHSVPKSLPSGSLVFFRLR